MTITLKKRWLSMVLAVVMLSALIIPQLATSAEDGDLEDRLQITVSDSTGEEYTYDSATDTGNEKKFHAENEDPPILHGNPYVDVDLVRNDNVDEVSYVFEHTSPDGGAIKVINGDIDVNKKETFYPDIEKSKQGYMTAQHYDVSNLFTYTGSSGTNEQILEWSNRAKVFAVPFGGIVYKSAKTSTAFLTGSLPYVTKITQTGGKNLYSTNTVFYQGMSTTDGSNALKEASKFWGYIKFPDAGTYYIASVADDGSRTVIIDDREPVIIDDKESLNNITVTHGRSIKIDGNTHKDVEAAPNEFVVQSNFYPHWYQINTTNEPFIVTKDDLDRYFPIYIEYFNWGGDGQLRLIYSNIAYPDGKINQGGYGGNGDLKTIDGTKSYLNNSKYDQIKDIPESWFYPSKSGTPAEAPTSKFISTAQDGIEFPTDPGTYYVTIIEKMEDGTTNETKLGPFVILDAPDGFIKETPSGYYTSKDVNLKFIVTKGDERKDDGDAVTLEKITEYNQDGTVAKVIPVNMLASEYEGYDAPNNGRYVFTISSPSQPGKTFDFEHIVDIIDKVEPTVVLSIEGNSDDTRKIIVNAKDKFGYEVDGKHPLDVSSGSLTLVSVERTRDSAKTNVLNNSNKQNNLTQTVAKLGDNDRHVEWTLAATSNSKIQNKDKFTIVVQDQVGNKTTVTITVSTATFTGKLEYSPTNYTNGTVGIKLVREQGNVELIDVKIVKVQRKNRSNWVDVETELNAPAYPYVYEAANNGTYRFKYEYDTEEGLVSADSECTFNIIDRIKPSGTTPVYDEIGEKITIEVNDLVGTFESAPTPDVASGNLQIESAKCNGTPISVASFTRTAYSGDGRNATWVLGNITKSDQPQEYIFWIKDAVGNKSEFKVTVPAAIPIDPPVITPPTNPPGGDGEGGEGGEGGNNADGMLRFVDTTNADGSLNLVQKGRFQADLAIDWSEIIDNKELFAGGKFVIEFGSLNAMNFKIVNIVNSSVYSWLERINEGKALAVDVNSLASVGNPAKPIRLFIDIGEGPVVGNHCEIFIKDIVFEKPADMTDEPEFEWEDTEEHLKFIIVKNPTIK